ncbi:cupredoxin domain-containing protein [Aliiroseovarius crassostreae]|uniref:cupredoxin domain-containing protein n=1 Tax=Aliiroseovarius crassostreae TaxID=154981 RepID=UPI003C7CA209
MKIIQPLAAAFLASTLAGSALAGGAASDDAQATTPTADDAPAASQTADDAPAASQTADDAQTETQGSDDAQTASKGNADSELCAEAEDRYVELFGHPSSEEEGVTVVTMYKYNFCPSELSVPVGTTVRWVNVDKRTSHSVIVKGSGEPESDRAFPEETIEFTFLTEGPQDILCGPHWETQDMFSKITVEPAETES